LTDTGCAALFSNWSGNAGLKIIELERCCLFGDASVAAILQHSGKSLHKLVLNSLDAITSEGAGMLAALDALPVCHELDISWIRVVDDLIVRRLVENMPALEKLLVWGNNLLTSVEHPGKAVVVGRESG
jgi:DNA repair protein RAD7